MFLKLTILVITGLSFGILSSAGVFTALSAVGLIPRFAGKLHLADHVFTLEEAVILGAISGGLVSQYADQLQKWSNQLYAFCGSGSRLECRSGEVVVPILLLKGVGGVILLLFGLFSGMFVGCLALAIAEMLNSIPVFARRIGFEKGLSIAILAAAAGKLIGSLLYFSQGIFHAGG